MKRLILFAAMFLLVQVVFAGGILTNSNQSAQYVRMLSRNASTQLDAVYFNPAGIMKMENGFHFGIHNQTISQTRTITTGAPLNSSEFIGDVSAPVFPTAFAVYKMDNLAFSFGFGPNGGGGSADYKNGLPSFEGQIASQVNGQLVPQLAGLSAFGFNVQQGYDVDIAFKGQSVFWGIQLGVSAKINDILSVYGGARYLPSTNTYTGSIENIQLKVNGSFVNAQEFLGQASTAVAGKAQEVSTAATGLQPLVTAAGAYTLAQVQGAGYIDATKRAQIEGGLLALGVSQAQINAMNMTQIQGAYVQGATTLNTQSATLAGTAVLLGDKAVDTKQTGAGITPIIGVNITPIENMNIGLKYEFQTGLKLTNETKVDDTGMFPDGQKSSSDIPAILSAGIDYKFCKAFSAQLSYTNYFDKAVNWGNNIYDQERVIDNNLWELALGLQYDISDKFAVSIGGLKSQTGVSEQYQSDFSYSNSSTSGAFGFQWKATKALTLDAGMLYTTYKDEDKSFGTYSETYDKENIVFAVGLSYSIF